MKLIKKLNKLLSPIIPSNLTIYLLVGQVVAFIIAYSFPPFLDLLFLQGSLVLQGQWWRLITVLFMPIAYNPILAAFVFYLYYIYGSALEREWGKFHYFLYLFTMYLAMIAIAFAFPNIVLTNSYLYGSLFLAFAHLYPDYTLLLFFILPVKIKWLALILWLQVGVSIVLGTFAQKVLALLSVSNYLLFFGRNILFSAKNISRKASKKIKKKAKADESYMKCSVCGATEKDNKAFYYCQKCQPPTWYCEDHIKEHKHKLLKH